MSEDFVFGNASDSDGSEAPHFVTGQYIVTCAAVENAGPSKWPKTDEHGEPLTDRDGNIIYPNQWKWVFAIEDVDARRPTKEQQELIGKSIFRWTNQTLGPKSNTRLFIEALIGRPLKSNEQPSTKWVIGRQAIASIGQAEEGRIKKFLLMPYITDESDPIEPGNDREALLADIYDTEDRRDLAALRERIEQLKLTDDTEVMSVYEMTQARLSGDRNAPPRGQRALS